MYPSFTISTAGNRVMDLPVIGPRLASGRDVLIGDVLAAPLNRRGNTEQRPELGADWGAVRIRPHLIDQRDAARQLGGGECPVHVGAISSVIERRNVGGNQFTLPALLGF